MKVLIILTMVLMFSCEGKDEKKCQQATFVYTAAVIAKDMLCQQRAAIDKCDAAKAAVMFAELNKKTVCGE